jgi:hypothetical protein
VSDHSTLGRTRQRLPLAVHQAVVALILGIVDSTYLRADASMKAIVRRDTTETYPEFATRLATEAGVNTPRARTLGGSTGSGQIRRRPTARGTRAPIPMPTLPSGRMGAPT